MSEYSPIDNVKSNTVNTGAYLAANPTYNTDEEMPKRKTLDQALKENSLFA